MFFSLEMYNKTIIGFSFCNMQNYPCIGEIVISLAFGWTLIILTSTLIILHITKTLSNNFLILCNLGYIFQQYLFYQFNIFRFISTILKPRELNLLSNNIETSTFFVFAFMQIPKRISWKLQLLKCTVIRLKQSLNFSVERTLKSLIISSESAYI